MYESMNQSEPPGYFSTLQIRPITSGKWANSNVSSPSVTPPPEGGVGGGLENWQDIKISDCFLCANAVGAAQV
jgi:hypothetical protein